MEPPIKRREPGQREFWILLAVFVPLACVICWLGFLTAHDRRLRDAAKTQPPTLRAEPLGPPAP